jgi:aldehyde dehydrogenase (NAD+)
VAAVVGNAAHRHRRAEDLQPRARPARPEGVFNLVIGKSATVGETLIADRRIPLVSFTGSTEVGRHVSEVVARRLGRGHSELGGNNGIVVMDDADPALVVRAVLFGAVGTAGQRCTTTRRLFLQRGIASKITAALEAAYRQVKIGAPIEETTLMGPLVNRARSRI